MGVAITSLREGFSLLSNHWRSTGLIAIIAFFMSAGIVFSQMIPFAGAVLTIPFIIVGVALMYAIANHAAEHGEGRLDVGFELFRARWLSFLGAYAMIFIAGVVLVMLIIVPFFVVLTLMLITAHILIGLVGLAVLGILGCFAYFGYAMLMQLLFPLIAIERLSAVDALSAAMSIIRSNPLSAIGFTLIRLCVQYIPFILGGFAAAVLARAGIQAVYEEFTMLIEDPPADLAEQPAVLELFLQAMDPIDLVLMFVVIFGAGVVGETIRVAYTTSFVRSVRQAE